MARRDSATAFAPASIGNVGVGFDMLGLAISGAGDRVTARRSPAGNDVVIAEVRGIDGEIHPKLAAKTDENTAGVAARSFWLEHGDGGGVELEVRKGIPLQSGMGSSAASAVAGCVAVNALLEEPLPVEALLGHALAGEKLASGTLHADNVAPSLLGGLVLCPPVLHPRLIRLEVPADLSSVLLHPDLLVSTAESRQSLSDAVTRDQWLAQQGYFGSFLAALSRNDHELIAACLKDVIIEPQRASAVPCFDDVKGAALDAGALGSSLSGSGPSIFAICPSAEAERVAAAMHQACRQGGYACETWVSPMSAPGACVENGT